MKSAKIYTWHNRTLTAAQWAIELDITYMNFLYRLNKFGVTARTFVYGPLPPAKTGRKSRAKQPSKLLERCG